MNTQRARNFRSLTFQFVSRKFAPSHILTDTQTFSFCSFSLTQNSESMLFLCVCVHTMPCHVGPPKMDRSWWRVLTKHGPLEKGMPNHFSILALRTPLTVWKGKKIWHWKMNCPGWWVPNMLLENSGEITPDKTKRWNQRKNSNQLWICLVVKVKSHAVKNNTA